MKNEIIGKYKSLFSSIIDNDLIPGFTPKTNRNDEIFSLISKGSHISEGQLFIMFDERLLKSSEK